MGIHILFKWFQLRWLSLRVLPNTIRMVDIMSWTGCRLYEAVICEWCTTISSFLLRSRHVSREYFPQMRGAGRQISSGRALVNFLQSWIQIDTEKHFNCLQWIINLLGQQKLAIILRRWFISWDDRANTICFYSNVTEAPIREIRGCKTIAHYVVLWIRAQLVPAFMLLIFFHSAVCDACWTSFYLLSFTSFVN